MAGIKNEMSTIAGGHLSPYGDTKEEKSAAMILPQQQKKDSATRLQKEWVRANSRY